MIIPIRCITCGKPIAGKYEQYKKLVKEKSGGEFTDEANLVMISDALYKGKTPQCEALDELGFTRMCCRRMILSHVEILQNIAGDNNQS